MKLTFYEGSDRPRLLLAGALTADFTNLQRVFRALSQGGEPVDFHHQPFIEAEGTLQLRAICRGTKLPHPFGVSPGLLRERSAGDQAFFWQQTAEEWDDFVGLMEGLIASPMPGHQYLSSSPRDDAVVVVSKGEVLG